MSFTSNFSWPVPDDSELVRRGAAAMRALGSAVDVTVFSQGTAVAGLGAAVAGLGTAVEGLEFSKVDTAGGTMTGLLVAPNVGLGVGVEPSDTVALDFAADDGFVTRSVGGTAVVVTGTGYGAGRSKTLRLVGGTVEAALSVPSEWTFVGQAVGTAVGTAVTAVLTATAFGTAESDVVAAWAEEA